MSRFTRKIKNKTQLPLQVIILAAGAGSRTKSYEPRCLLKYKNKVILDSQIEIIKNRFTKSEITVVGGIEGYKIIKRLEKDMRFVENQIHEDSNSGESLKLGINNSIIDNILFLHGDLVFSESILNKIDMDKSCLLIDNSGKIEDKEVGVTVVNGKATVLSYNLPTKWCQIAYLSQNETNILRKLLVRTDFNTRYLLTFEIINKMIELGASFDCIDIEDGFIKEIDSLKDINNENFS